MPPFESILIVDDDPAQGILLDAYFRGMGITSVASVGGAVEAIDRMAVSDVPFDLIVSDLLMPDMDGIEFLRALKKVGFHGKIALISSLDQTLIDSAKKLGELHGFEVIGTCRKPLTKQVLDDIFKAPHRTTAQASGGALPDLSSEDVVSALDRGELIPFYQPKVDILTGRIVGAEALTRWVTPDGGVIAPGRFMAFIEEGGLVRRLTDCLLDRSIADIARWKLRDIDVKVAINITAKEISDIALPDHVGAVLKNAGVHASNLCLEVTERDVLSFNTVTLEVLSRLRLMGVDIAIDDFGTGYSNLNALRDFPYCELKVDQSFVRGQNNDAFSRETLRAAVTLGRHLNMRILVEGVETEEEWNFVKGFGVDQVQGYYVAKPMAADDFAAFYESNGGVFGAALQAD
ncbi:MAG: EAL domain-containing response regulator [Pseudomonadota bacterium]